MYKAMRISPQRVHTDLQEMYTNLSVMSKELAEGDIDDMYFDRKGTSYGTSFYRDLKDIEVIISLMKRSARAKYKKYHID